jgi:hypothetical protein
MKKFLLFAIIASFGLGQNIMIFPQLSTGSETQLQVSVEIENTDDFVGFQFDLPLNNELEFISGSTILTGRSNGHAISASIVNGNTLRLFAYSMSQTPFTGNSGAVCSFYLTTGTVPGNYPLTPVDPIIGNATSQNILTAVTSGQVTIQSPDIDIPTQGMNYDRVPLTSYSDRSFTIYNQGNSTLNVTSITTSHADFELQGASTRTISAGSSESVTVRFHSNTKGIYSETVTILSDDPDEATQSVALDVIAYAVNELDINNMFGRSGYNSTMTIDIANMEEFVGFSFDLQLPRVMTYIPGTVQLTARAGDHVVDATTLENGDVRIVAYSPSNAVFSGTEGDVVELAFALDGLGGYYSLQFSNPVIGDINSENIISDDYSGTLEIASPDLAVNQSSFDFGLVSIFDTSLVNLTISNTGSDTLHISSLIFDEISFFTDIEAPIQIVPSANQTIPIQYHNSTEGIHSASLRIRSNDPDEDPQDIAFTANSFIPNIMRIDDATLYSLSSGWVGVSIENNESFVGFQFDLEYSEGIDYSGTSELTSRADGHQVSITDLGNGILRTIVYALDQSEFIGTSGEVIRFQFNAIDTTAQLSLQLTSPIIGNAASEDILSSYENRTVGILYGGPTVNAPEQLSILEDSDSTITFESLYTNFSDPNTEDASLTLLMNGSDHISVEISSANWVVTPDTDWHGSENLELIVSDENYADTTGWEVSVSPVNDAPVLADISSQEIAEDGDLVIVLSADDIDGDNLTFSAESADANVTVLVSNDSLYMTPSDDWNGSSVITVTVADGSGSDNSTDSGTFTLTVTPVNDAPVLTDISSQSTPEEMAVDVALSADDIDEDALTYSAVSDTSAVGVSITGSTLTLTPGTDFIGDASITVTVSDGSLEDSGSFTLTVSPVNDAPILEDISSQEIAEDGDLVIVLSADDIDGDNLTFSAESTDAEVSVLVSNDSLYMTPAADWNGSSVITVTVDDGSGSDNATDSGTFTLTVTPVNDAPIIADISSQSTPEETAVDVALSAADIDEDDLTYIAVSDTSAVVVSVTGSTLTLTPGTDFIGDAQITVTVSDGSLEDSSSFTLTITPVNDAPVLAGISDQEITEDGGLVIVLSAEDIDGDALSYSAESADANVTVLVSNDSLYMTPSADWNGSSVITVTVDDGSGEDNATDTGTFTLTVTPVNDAPIIADISAQSTPEETAIDVALAASDIDEDALTYSAMSDTSAVVVSITGSILTLTPGTDFIGDAQITVTVTDGSLEDSGSFVLTVSPVNDAPVLVDIAAQEIAEDGDLVIVLSAADIDGDNLTFSAESADANVTVTVSNDSLHMTPVADWNGSSVITVTVDDGSGSDNSTDSGTFTLTVTPVNDAPELSDISAQSTPEETVIDIALSAEDIDEDEFTYSTVSDTAAVLVSIIGSTLTLTPQTDFIGDAIITVMVMDTSLSDTGSFTLTVTPVNDAPVLSELSTQEIIEDSELAIVLSAEDIDGDDLSYSAVSADANVTVHVFNDSLYMTPAADWNGSSVITVTVDDGSGSENSDDTGTFTLTVTPVNDAPVLAVIAALSTPEETAADVALSAEDIDGDDLTYSAESNTSEVAVSVSGSTLTLTPQMNWNGIALITVIVDDSIETVNSADTTSFTLTVIPVNDPPQIHTAAQDTSIFEDTILLIPFWISDEDETDTLTVTIIGDVDNLSGSYTDSLLTIIPDDNWNGSVSVMLQVSDNDTTVTDTFELIVLPVNDSPQTFDLIYPDNEMVIDDTDSIAVSFSWETAQDIDGDTLLYGLDISGDSEFDSLFIVTGPQLRMNIEDFPRDVWLNWDVWVTDGQDTVWSTSTFILMIDQVVGINAQTMVPDEFTLNQNYPNPFNPTTTIRYGLPEVTDVSVIIYDLRGREIKTWNFDTQSAGWYNLAWRGDSKRGEQIGTGLYFCRIVAGEYSKTVKMIYMK